MIDERQLFAGFHSALDVEPRPGAYDRLRTALVKSQAEPQREAWFSLGLPRSSMRLVAGVLMLVLAVAAFGAFLAINQYARRPVPVHTHTGAVSRMCAQGDSFRVTGWQRPTRPTDWSNVSPPNVPGGVKGGGAICILDADHAWVTQTTGNPNCPGTPPCAGPQPDHVVVLSTQDGGKTWQQGQPIPATGSNLATELDFLDGLHGWLLTDSASPQFVRAMYSTSDGGLHWNRLTSGSPTDRSVLGGIVPGCSETGMTFVSVDRGWLTWNCSSSNGTAPAQTAGVVVAATSDGGRNWTPVSLPGICGAAPPIFSGSQGVLQSQCGNYWTSDSGKTWNLARALPFNVQVEFIDGRTGFYFQTSATGSDLYRTDDSGRDWTAVTKGLFSGDTIDSYQFIDASTGFANIANSPATWKTVDGGKTWLLPAPYRSIGNVVCPLPWNPPAAGSVPVPVKMVSATTGWAAGALRTTDGGSHWSNAGPLRGSDRSSGHSEFFLDETHAWVAQAAGSSTACADHVVVFSTADGGGSWQQAARINLQLPTASDATYGNWAPSVDFVDTEHGWLMIEIYRGFASVAGPMYRTSDGGHSWTMVSSPAGFNAAGCAGLPPISFSSTTTGWMGAQCQNDASLLVTHDGGATWRVQVLAPANPTSVSLLHFFDESSGMFFDSSEPLLLMTSDGGNRWSRHALPPLSYFSCLGKYGPTTCSDEGIAAVSFINPREGWAVVSKANASGAQTIFRIEHSVNGGQRWTTINAKLPHAASLLDPSNSSLSFVDASDGFWWSGTVFLRTTDGGHTWTAVQMTTN